MQCYHVLDLRKVLGVLDLVLDIEIGRDGGRDKARLTELTPVLANQTLGPFLISLALVSPLLHASTSRRQCEHHSVNRMATIAAPKRNSRRTPCRLRRSAASNSSTCEPGDHSPSSHSSQTAHQLPHLDVSNGYAHTPNRKATERSYCQLCIGRVLQEIAG